MIKIDVSKTTKGITTLMFEARQNTPEGLEELDEAYSALLGSREKRGGYLDSNRFKIEVKDEEKTTGDIEP